MLSWVLNLGFAAGTAASPAVSVAVSGDSTVLRYYRAACWLAVLGRLAWPTV